MSKEDRHFDIDASIVFQLGEGLISDSVQALVELIKNCWDADSTRVRITVSTTSFPADIDSYFKQTPGYILIEDDGVGMNEEELILGFLLISNSSKREQKATGTKTKRSRTPLGEKGLGRLGVQRLGDNVEIITEKAQSSRRYHVGWSWNDFKNKKRLSEMSPKWDTKDAIGRQGTRLLITGLRELSTWDSKETLERFKLRLSQMISPYAEFPQFKIRGTINGRELELADISAKIRSLATLRYAINFDGQGMSIAGRMRLDYIRPSKRATEQERRDFDELVQEDKGSAFFDFLASQSEAPIYQLKRDTATGWFCQYQTRFELREIDKATVVDGIFANPGPFLAEVDSYNLEDDDSQQVLGGQSSYKQYVKNFSGIRVFRDGFGIRTDEDWLGLGRAFTGGGSFYALRPANIMGFVSITAENNQALREATDREGFIRTAEYDNFVLLFGKFAQYAEKAQEFVRRGYNKYREQTARRQAELPETAAPDEVARVLVTNVSRAAALREQLGHVDKTSIASAVRDAESVSKTLRASPNKSEIAKSISQVADIQKALESTGTQLRNVQGELNELSKLTGQAKLLQHQVETLQHQMREAASTISLGLTAEALSHEVANVADRLADKTNDISKYLTRANISDERVIAFAEHVRATVNALRKQMAHLAPSLRFARERRQTINVGSFLTDLAVYHNERLADKNVSVVVRGESSPFNVRMNQGKLTQVIDNLVINSEYWVKEAVRIGRVDRGTITVRHESPYIKVSDNGLGIDPHMEPVLFQPFNTSRKNGRGLGLFIVKQLLENDDCSIAVSPRRNSESRLYQFVIDLSGVTDGDEK